MKVEQRGTRTREFAAALTRAAGVPITLSAQDRATTWTIEWTDGPTVDQMRDHLHAQRAALGIPELRLCRPEFVRHPSPRAWAALAVAAQRDGSLARAVAAGAAARRAHPAARPDVRPHDTETRALRAYVQALFDATAWPERADHPADEPLVLSLVTAADGRIDRMNRLLTTPAPEHPRLRVVAARGH